MTADQFKTARKSKGMTQRQLCAFLGVSFSAVTKWETGANPIPKWVEEKLLARQEVTLRGLSAAEIAKFQQKAAARGMSADEIAAELIRNFLKLSLLAFGFFHLCQSPTDWHAAALAKSLGKAVALIASLA